MSPQHQRIERFLAIIRRQKNRHRLWTTLIWATLAGAVAMIVVGLCYVLRGYAVPGIWTGVIAGAALGVAVAAWGIRRWNAEHTAHFTDRFFELQDTVTSYLHFSAHGCHDGYYALQATQTASRIEELDPGSVRYRPPRRIIGMAAGLLLVAVPISLLPDSDAVVQRRQAEEITQQQTTEINRELEKEVEKLIEETKDKNEKELIQPDKLRRWVKELKTMKDRKEALRQYAQLQRKLKKFQLALQRKKDEQLLQRAAKELKKQEETRPIAKMLEQKKYDETAKKLEKLKPTKTKDPAKKKRDLAKLRNVAQRMAEAARMTRMPAKSMKASQSKGSGQSKVSKKQTSGNCNASRSCKACRSGSESGEGSEGKLSESMEGLLEAIEKCDKKGDGEEAICEEVDKLTDELKKMAICRRAQCRLKKLGQCCSQCQGNMCCQSMCMVPKTGGKKPGWASSSSKRDQRDELVDNGQTTQLKGLKGKGPSLTTVEAAEEGSGVSNRRSVAKERQFKHGFESFVQREDVPEAVKDGVKTYFQIIHENEIEASPQEKSE